MVKAYEDLTFTDDFMFCKVFYTNKDLCKDLIELILCRKVKDIVYQNYQESLDITSDGKSVRLDVYLEDDENTVYDIEMQTTHQKDLAKRSRYYQGMIDLNLIEKGAYYSELKKTYVIFICLTDPFDRNLAMYHFKNICEECTDLSLNDEAEKIFLNAKGIREHVSPDLSAFLDYLNGNLGDNKFVRALDQAVQKTKNHEEWRAEYMTLLQRDRENIEKGRAEEKINAIIRMIKIGDSDEKIKLYEYTDEEICAAHERIRNQSVI